MQQKFKSYSQISQDIFIVNFFKKQKGYFVDLGCGDGFSEPCGNNTALLEDFEWTGLGIDFNQSYVDSFNSKRKSKAVCKDLTKIKLKDILQENNCPKIIDYLSFDVDDATDKTLDNFPINDFKFKLITFEHNLYLGQNSQYANLKEKAKNLFNQEYDILIEDVKLSGFGAVEDWYIHKELTKNFDKKYLKDIFDFEILKQYEIGN